MTDMVERVARAIAWTELTPKGQRECDWKNDFAESDRRKFRVMASAAIAAMPLRNSLGRIARGRTDCGRPLAGEKARQLARGAMIDLGLNW